MRLVWTKMARRDPRSIFDHIFQNNPDAAADMDELFAKAADQLRHFPLSGRVGRMWNTRELLVHPSYLLVYDIRDDAIRMLALVHTARRWPPE